MNKETKKILVVDDSRGWLEFHKTTIEEIYGEQIAVSTAICAREGYCVVYNNMNTPFDLIISDLQMELDFEPKHAGEWFIERVKELNAYKNTPIIIMSAAYNIRSIANKLEVSCLPKASAARDLNAYKFAIDELMN